ncbi:hypothetical protein D3C81_1394390 [compost metagenome]
MKRQRQFIGAHIGVRIAMKRSSRAGGVVPNVTGKLNFADRLLQHLTGFQRFY